MPKPVAKPCLRCLNSSKPKDNAGEKWGALATLVDLGAGAPDNPENWVSGFHGLGSIGFRVQGSGFRV